VGRAIEGTNGTAPVAAPNWQPTLVFALLLSYFGLFGVTFGVQGVIWADLVNALSLSKGVFGTAQLSAPLVSIVILLQAEPLCNRFGKKRLALVGLASLGIAIAWMALANNLWALVGSLALSGAGFGLIETSANSATLDWEDATGRKVMNFMHAGFSGGAVLGALLAAAMLKGGLDYHQVFLAVALLPLLIFVATLPVRYAPTETPTEAAAGSGAALRLLFSSRLIVALAIICLISTIGESVANNWLAIYLSDLGAPVWLVGATFALFNITMLIGRLGNAALVARFGERLSLIVAGICMLVAGIIMTATTLLAPIVVAFAMLGIAVAGAIPTVLSATARIAPGKSGSVTGAIMSVAYLSFIICPPLIGWVAEMVSLRAALLIVVVIGIAQFALARSIPGTPMAQARQTLEQSA
jgi:MFS family permease